MKRYVYSSLLAVLALLGFAACSSEEDVGPQSGEKAVSTFTVSVPDAFVVTRANDSYVDSKLPGYQNVGSTGRVYLSMYNADGSGDPVWTGNAAITGKPATFKPVGFKGAKVKFVAYATAGDKTLDSEDLGQIAVANSLNDEVMDCFTGVQNGTFGETTEMTLARPSCKVRLVADDGGRVAERYGVSIDKVEMFAADGSEIKSFGKFNAVTGVYSDEQSVALGTESIPLYTAESGLDARTLLVDYIPVNAGGVVSVPVTIKVHWSANGTSNVSTVTLDGDKALPVKRNRLITIRGDVLSEESEFTVIIDDGYVDIR